MRWLYFNDDPGEAAEREAIVARIDAWWRAFADQTAALESHFKRESEWDLPGWMDHHLAAIDPRIMWEYGPAMTGEGHRLVLTPESAHELRPLVAQILARAPIIPGWEFYDARLPEDLAMASRTVEARAAGYDISDFLVRVSISERRLIDLCYYSPRIEGPDDQSAFAAAFVATETLLGERCLDRWVGTIEVSPFPEQPDPTASLGSGRVEPRYTLKLDQLREMVDAAVETILDQLPGEPHARWVQDAEWTIWELKPDEADDYPGQSDLFVGKSGHPALWVAAHSEGVFHSARFTRADETFAYVKVDGTHGLEGSSFADKSAIEDALETTLVAGGLGCTIGGGMGRRYAYIDLALTDVHAAIAAIRTCLQTGNIPHRSWILFFDAELGDEWVGVYQDTPPPPRLE